MDRRVKPKRGFSSDLGGTISNVTTCTIRAFLSSLHGLSISWHAAFETRIGGLDSRYQSCPSQSMSRKMRSTLILRTPMLYNITTSMFLNPDNTRFFNNSQPIPPAPTSKTRLEATLAYSESPRMRALWRSRAMEPETKKKRKVKRWSVEVSSVT